MLERDRAKVQGLKNLIITELLDVCMVYSDPEMVVFTIRQVGDN